MSYHRAMPANLMISSSKLKCSLMSKDRAIAILTRRMKLFTFLGSINKGRFRLIIIHLENVSVLSSPKKSMESWPEAHWLSQWSRSVSLRTPRSGITSFRAISSLKAASISVWNNSTRIGTATICPRQCAKRLRFKQSTRLKAQSGGTSCARISSLS